MYKNLNQYIATLEREGELIRITAQVDPELEMSEIIDRVSKTDGGGKALLFENTGTEFAVLANMMGSERRMALALAVTDLDELPEKITTLLNIVKQPRRGLLDKLRLLPILRRVGGFMPRHSRRRGECQQIIDRNPDLTKLPILKTWPADGGRFFTLPMVHTIDPENGMRNVGMYRMQVFSPTTTGMHWHKHKTGARHYEKYKSLVENSKFPVAVTLGGDPAYTYAATAPLPDGIDEYILAGFLRNKAVKLVKCITCDIEVPSDCDFVIEGYIDTAEAKVTEGPFGDHTGFYSLEDMYPTLHVRCITHRRDAIYPATVVGVPPMEDRYIALATERIFLEPIKAAIAPEIRSLTMPWQGVAHNLAIVEIDKSYEGQGFKVASALWGAGQMAFCKFIVITDSNSTFNIQNSTFKGELLFSRAVADVLDHAGDQVGVGGKLCIDTTSAAASEYTINIVYDDHVQELTSDEQLWIALANTDPCRDITVDGDVITIDARSKTLQDRDFPNIVTMSDEIIEKVDSRWDEYGFTKFIASPSRRYKKLIKGDGAIYAKAKNERG